MTHRLSLSFAWAGHKGQLIAARIADVRHFFRKEKKEKKSLDTRFFLGGWIVNIF